MLRTLLLSLTTLGLLMPNLALAQENNLPALNVSKLPAKAKAPENFLQPGWQIESKVSGDLNSDKVADLAISLIQTRPAGVSEDENVNRERALLVLLKGKDGLWQKVGLGQHVLQCTACGGAFYGVMDAPVELKIEKGVLIVEQDHGSRNINSQLFRFWWDAKLKKLVLIGMDLRDHDRLSGESSEESFNYLTGKKITTQRKMDSQGNPLPVKNTTQSIPKRQQTLEQFKYDEY